MKRYKPLNFHGIYDNFSLLSEAVIKVEAYDKLLNSFFKKCESSIKGKNISLESIVKTLNKEFSFLKIIFQVDSKLKEEEGGTDDDKYNTIYIFLIPKSNLSFYEYEDKYINFLISIIHHELIHRNQAIRMKDQEIISYIFGQETEDIKEYLQKKDEIMSFAFMIIEDSRAHGWSDDKILKYLKSYVNPSRIFNSYLDIFDKDSDVIKTLVKYMYQYLQK